MKNDKSAENGYNTLVLFHAAVALSTLPEIKQKGYGFSNLKSHKLGKNLKNCSHKIWVCTKRSDALN